METKDKWPLSQHVVKLHLAVTEGASYFIEVSTSVQSWTVAKTTADFLVFLKILSKGFPSLHFPELLVLPHTSSSDVSSLKKSSASQQSSPAHTPRASSKSTTLSSSTSWIPPISVKAFLEYITARLPLILCFATHEFFRGGDSDKRAGALEPPTLREEFRGELSYAERHLRVQPSMETTVRPNQSFTHSCDVRIGERQDADAVLVWEFKTNDYDIGFTIVQRIGSETDDSYGDQERVIVAYSRQQSQHEKIVGYARVQKAGTYYFVWSNTFSKYRSKRLAFKVSAIPYKEWVFASRATPTIQQLAASRVTVKAVAAVWSGNAQNLKLRSKRRKARLAKAAHLNKLAKTQSTGDVQLDKFVGDLEVFICEKLRKGKQLNYQVLKMHLLQRFPPAFFNGHKSLVQQALRDSVLAVKKAQGEIRVLDTRASIGDNSDETSDEESTLSPQELAVRYRARIIEDAKAGQRKKLNETARIEQHIRKVDVFPLHFFLASASEQLNESQNGDKDRPKSEEEPRHWQEVMRQELIVGLDKRKSGRYDIVESEHFVTETVFEVVLNGMSSDQLQQTGTFQNIETDVKSSGNIDVDADDTFSLQKSASHAALSSLSWKDCVELWKNSAMVSETETGCIDFRCELIHDHNSEEMSTLYSLQDTAESTKSPTSVASSQENQDHNVKCATTKTSGGSYIKKRTLFRIVETWRSYQHWHDFYTASEEIRHILLRIAELTKSLYTGSGDVASWDFYTSGYYFDNSLADMAKERVSRIKEARSGTKAALADTQISIDHLTQEKEQVLEAEAHLEKVAVAIDTTYSEIACLRDYVKQGKLQTQIALKEMLDMHCECKQLEQHNQVLAARLSALKAINQHTDQHNTRQGSSSRRIMGNNSGINMLGSKIEGGLQDTLAEKRDFTKIVVPSDFAAAAAAWSSAGKT